MAAVDADYVGGISQLVSGRAALHELAGGREEKSVSRSNDAGRARATAGIT